MGKRIGKVIFVALALVTSLSVLIQSDAGTEVLTVKWAETADSAKIFIRSTDSTLIVDSTAGVARTNIASYDTSLTLNRTDSSYEVALEVWYPGTDSAVTYVILYPQFTADQLLDDPEFTSVFSNTRKPADSLTKFKYVSPVGDNSDGDSWATAYTSLDGFNAVRTAADSAFNYRVYVAPFRDSAVHCTVYVANTVFEFHPGYIGLNEYEVDTEPNTSSFYWMTIQADNVELYGNGAHLKPDTVRDSALDRDWADAGQEFPGAIKLDSAINDVGAANDGADDVIIDGFYVDMGHKPITLWPDFSDVSSLHDRTIIRNCVFVRPKHHAIDGRGRDTRIHDNIFIGRASSELTPTVSIQVITNSHRWFITANQQIGGAKIFQTGIGSDSIWALNNTGIGINDEFYTADDTNDVVGWLSQQTFDETYQRGGGNLLSNASFERYDGPRSAPTDWTTDGADRQGGWLQFHAHGNFSFFLNGASDTAYARSNAVFLDSSETYSVAGEVFATGVSQQFKVAIIPESGVALGDTFVVATITATQNQFDQWQANFRPPTSEMFHLVPYAPADLVYIDNLYLGRQNYAQGILDYTEFTGEYLGAPCDSSFQELFPFGTAPKDSIRTYCIENAGADTTLVRTVVFFKNAGIVDSVVTFGR